MKTVTMDEEQFEKIVYMACATITPDKNDPIKDTRMTAKVLDKLEDKDKSRETGEDRGFKLIKSSATFKFEDAEAEWIVGRIAEYKAYARLGCSKDSPSNQSTSGRQ